MLQPKKDNYRLSKTDQESLEKEMIIYAEEGASDDDLIDFKNNYVAEKKKLPRNQMGSFRTKNRIRKRLLVLRLAKILMDSLK